METVKVKNASNQINKNEKKSKRVNLANFLFNMVEIALVLVRFLFLINIIIIM